MPRPARIPQEAARQRDQVRVAACDDRLGLRRLGDHARPPSSSRRSPRGSPARTAPGSRGRSGSSAPATCRRSTSSIQSHAAGDQPPREREGVVERPAAVHPSVAESRTPSGRRRATRRAPHRTPRAESACGCRTSRRSVVALVRERRQELVQQVAVRACAVRSHRCRARARAARRRRTPLATFARPARVERLRRRLALVLGIADGATGFQPPSSSGISAPPSHGPALDALRPACASWIATGIAGCARSRAARRAPASHASS